jgi:hypothetical protein
VGHGAFHLVRGKWGGGGPGSVEELLAGCERARSRDLVHPAGDIDAGTQDCVGSVPVRAIEFGKLHVVILKQVLASMVTAMRRAGYSPGDRHPLVGSVEFRIMELLFQHT